MREFWTWFSVGVIVAVLALFGIFAASLILLSIISSHRAHAEPAGTLPACISSAKLTGLLTDTGATAWPIEGLRAVRFLAIINRIDPPTDYRADAVLAAFPPGDGDRMMMFLVNGDCVSREKITLPAKTAVMAMKETFGGMSRRDFGVTLIHDQWSNGEPIPPWVKKACCGPEDAHKLTVDQVHQSKEGWRVDGYHAMIQNGAELPSPDGTYWIFYRTFPDGTQSGVYCFFVPIPSM